MNRQVLEQKFDPKFIKQRKGNFGTMLDYIEAHVVINRLNTAFDGNWSFEIAEYTQLEDEVVVLGKLTAEGVIKQQFGSSKVTMAKSNGNSLCIGDDLKSAASDALKKTATLLGVGLHLYGDIPASDATDDTTSDAIGEDTKDARDEMATISGNKGTDLVDKGQLTQIKKLRTGLGWSPEELQDRAERLFATREITGLNGTMATALIAYLENQGNGSK